MTGFAPRLVVISAILGSSTCLCGAGIYNYTNLVPGNASIVSDIPASWSGGGNPNTLIDGDYNNRWLTGNYDATWNDGGANSIPDDPTATDPANPADPTALGTWDPDSTNAYRWRRIKFPYTVTLTFNTPQRVTRVREFYNADGGGFQNVDITAKDSGGSVLAVQSNVMNKSTACWAATFTNGIVGVKTLVFTVKAHAQPTYWDTRLSEIMAYDDGGGQNFALTATVASNSTFVGGTPATIIDEDIGSMAYGPNNENGWVVYNLGGTRSVGGFRIRAPDSGAYQIAYKIRIPDGSGGWTDLVDVAASTGITLHNLNETIRTSVVRLEMGYNGGGPDLRWRMYELEILEGRFRQGSVIFIK